LRLKISIPVAGCAIFLLAGVLCLLWSKRSATPQSFANQFSSRLERQLGYVNEDAGRLKESIATGDYRIRSEYPYFVYRGQQIVYWSDNAFVPSYASVADSFRLRLLRAGNSDYLAKQFVLSNNHSLVFIIPLYRRFNITNDYLSAEWNRDIFPSGNISILEPTGSIGVPVCAEGICPFKVSFARQDFQRHNMAGMLAVVFFGVAILCLVIFFYGYFKKFRYPEVGLFLLYLLLLGLRYLMVGLNFPSAVIATDLFNPQIFASSALNASLGDLILNELAVLVLCIFLFNNYHHFRIGRFHRGRTAGGMLRVLFGVGIFLAFLYPFVMIQTLFNNSSITLDISQSLQFDATRLIAIGAVLLAGICSFLFAHPLIRLLIGYARPWQVILTFIAAAIIFVAINEISGQRYTSSLILAILYFFLVYGTRLYSSLMRLGFSMFAYLFIAIFFLSANGAYGIYHFSREEKISNQFRFAGNFLVDRDDFAEYLLQETANKIANDVFIQTRLFSPFLNRDAIRQKIRQVFLPGYFNKYDVEIYLFNASGEPLNNRNNTTFPQLISAFDKDAYETKYEGVRFINSPAGIVTQQYLVKVPVKRMGVSSGYVVLTLGLKRVIPESVYPELLVDNRFQQIYRTQDLSYAVFSREGILYSSGDFNYDQQFQRTWLGNPEMHTEGFAAAGFDHIAQEDENGRVAVVSSPQPSRTFMLGNFSFLMVLGLAIILFFILSQGILNYLRGDKLYFSARIQLILNLAFFLPLIIVSISTLGLTNRFSQGQMREEYSDKARTVGDQLSVQLSEYLRGSDENALSFENHLTDLAHLTNLDANVYNGQGLLMATSQPLIFENSLISSYINASALRKIRRGESAFIETEQVGKLSYFVAYAPLKMPSTGELIGMVGIPFFSSGISLETAQINIFINILNIFTLIFIALVILSYFVSQWLTFPLTFITQSLRKTSLTRVNQPLVWKSDDEIGLMVREYNQMLYKLGESKAELEQTQRERAWREIAQQVAHEIKNPLTPMKLTLQQIERALQTGTNAVEKTGKAVGSLLAQVDTLNEIASSFSSFAKMPEPVIQRVELVSLLRRIVDLHSQSADLTFFSPVKELYVMGDEQLLGRTFSNFILNAVQASVPGRTTDVRISLETDAQNARLAFEDNGKGIEPEIAERIFIPHFTTKKSGSGLGLAIAKQAIEHMKGRIWFETKLGKGTTFFIALPLA